MFTRLLDSRPVRWIYIGPMCYLPFRQKKKKKTPITIYWFSQENGFIFVIIDIQNFRIPIMLKFALSFNIYKVAYILQSRKIPNNMITRFKVLKGLGSGRVKIGPVNKSFVTPAVNHIFRLLEVSTVRINIYFLDLIPKSYDIKKKKKKKNVPKSPDKCHNHKLKPTPDPKKKIQMTKTSTYITNKQMHEKHTDHLPLPQAR